MKTNSSSNRVALVTGGGRGALGRQFVRRLIQEEGSGFAFTYFKCPGRKALALVAENRGSRVAERLLSKQTAPMPQKCVMQLARR